MPKINIHSFKYSLLHVHNRHNPKKCNNMSQCINETLPKINIDSLKYPLLHVISLD